MDLAALNQLDAEEAQAHFRRCCGSATWAARMTAHRPYASLAALRDNAERVWWSLDQQDWLEAFTAHPRIGDVDSLRRKFADTKAWASGEQSGVATAPEDVLTRLAQGNDDYEKKFGYIFIVCATGKRADEMLAELEARLPNPPEKEIFRAATEQIKITLLRIDKWLHDGATSRVF